MSLVVPYLPVLSVIKRNSSVHKGLLYLLQLAWKSRLRLPYFIVIAFMIFDVRLTLEVIVDTPQDDDFDDDDDDDYDVDSEDEDHEHVYSDDSD